MAAKLSPDNHAQNPEQRATHAARQAWRRVGVLAQAVFVILCVLILLDMMINSLGSGSAAPAAASVTIPVTPDH